MKQKNIIVIFFLTIFILMIWGTKINAASNLISVIINGNTVIINKSRTCAACGNASMLQSTSVKNSTCTEKGYIVIYSKCLMLNCQKTTQETFIYSALGHNFGSWKTTKNATCTRNWNKGKKVFKMWKSRTKKH